MTEDKIALKALLEQASDTDFLRDMIGFAAERMMALEVQALTGADYRARKGRRSTQAQTAEARRAHGRRGRRRPCPHGVAERPKSQAPQH